MRARQRWKAVSLGVDIISQGDGEDEEGEGNGAGDDWNMRSRMEWR